MTILVTVLLYYKREDPKWVLTQSHENEFMKTFLKLKFTTSQVETMEPPPYGFRGFMVSINDKQYYIYREKVEIINELMYASDIRRVLESVLVNSAPVTIRDHLTFF